MHTIRTHIQAQRKEAAAVEAAEGTSNVRITKSEFYRAYSGRGPIRMFNDLIHDRQLQLDLIILTEVGDPLHSLCDTSLEQQKGNALEWASERALGSEKSWWGTCLQILHKVQDPTASQRLGTTPHLNVPCPNDTPWLDSEHGLQRKLFKFAVSLSSNTLWAHACFGRTVPHAIALLLRRTAPERHQSLKLLKEMVSAIQALEKLRQTKPRA